VGRRRKFTDIEKYCNKCVKWLPLDAFGENRRTASGKQDYCKTCHNAYTGSFWAKVAAYEQLLQQKWRMTPNDYLELWRTQGKKCAICGASLTLYHRDTLVRVFGCRKCLLCAVCNKGMECFRDDPRLLAEALEQVYGTANGEGGEKDKQKGAGDGANESPGKDAEKSEG